MLPIQKLERPSTPKGYKKAKITRIFAPCPGYRFGIPGRSRFLGVLSRQKAEWLRKYP